MPIKIAINGYGRIGRCILRAIYENELQNKFQIVAINDLGDPDVNVYLTKYDSTHGLFKKSISFSKEKILIDGKYEIEVIRQRDPKLLPWKKIGVDIVFECTGLFTSKKKSLQHIASGASKVLISAPSGKDVDATVVYGVNEDVLRPNMQVVSNASCTTNCLAIISKILNEKIGLVDGLMTTIHSYTNDQVLVDTYHSDLRRSRAAGYNMIPTKTGAASSLGLVLPELDGRLDGFAIRVPTMNVSVVDLTFNSENSTSIEEVNNTVLLASKKEKFRNILGYNVTPLVSSDFNHNSKPSVFDATQTRVVGHTLVKVLSWYDNEWGFANQMLRTTEAWFLSV